jgi:hypothetical protein
MSKGTWKVSSHSDPRFDMTLEGQGGIFEQAHMMLKLEMKCKELGVPMPEDIKGKYVRRSNVDIIDEVRRLIHMDIRMLTQGTGSKSERDDGKIEAYQNVLMYLKMKEE